MPVDDAAAVELRKIANLLALRFTSDLNRGERIYHLATCGFTNKEIAAITGSSEGSIRGFISQYRRRPSGAAVEE